MTKTYGTLFERDKAQRVGARTLKRLVLGKLSSSPSSTRSALTITASFSETAKLTHYLPFRLPQAMVDPE